MRKNTKIQRYICILMMIPFLIFPIKSDAYVMLVNDPIADVNFATSVANWVTEMANYAIELEEQALQGLALYEQVDTLRLQIQAVIKNPEFLLALGTYIELVGNEEINTVITNLTSVDPTFSVRFAEMIEKTWKYAPKKFNKWERKLDVIGSSKYGKSHKISVDRAFKKAELFTDQMLVLTKNHEDGKLRKTASQDLGNKIKNLGDSSDLQTMQIQAAQNQILISQQEANLEMMRESIKQAAHFEMEKTAASEKEREDDINYMIARHNQPINLGGANAMKSIDSFVF